MHEILLQGLYKTTVDPWFSAHRNNGFLMHDMRMIALKFRQIQMDNPAF